MCSDRCSIHLPGQHLTLPPVWLRLQSRVIKSIYFNQLKRVRLCDFAFSVLKTECNLNRIKGLPIIIMVICVVSDLNNQLAHNTWMGSDNLFGDCMHAYVCVIRLWQTTSVYLSVYPIVYLFVRLSACLPVCPSICLSELHLQLSYFRTST